MLKLSEILEEGKILLKQHQNLFNKLRQIPCTRDMTFRIDIIDGLKIGKPRFRKRYFLWSKELFAELRDHLEDTWIFFNSYSHWIDDTIMSILTYKKRRESKRSVIFLLESDIWETKEVFGDYLIEKKNQHTILSYYRFDKKFKTFEISTTDDLKIEQWIKNDAIKQIKNQFNYLWSKVESEIKTCMDEKFHKEPRLLLNSDYLLEQFKKTKKIVEDWPEASLLSLGRIIEMWVLIQLDRENNDYGNDLLKELEINSIINKIEFKFLSKIRRDYNDLKHKRFFKPDQVILKKYLSEFKTYIEIKKKKNNTL